MLNGGVFLRKAKIMSGAIIFCLLLSACDQGRQKADPNFDVSVKNTAYRDQKPKVLFDEAHRNIHTMDGLYQPFSKLISNDGYDVLPNEEQFVPTVLDGIDILVIANALGANDANDQSAFTDEECEIVRNWVWEGGSLLLITDHAPTGSAAQNLASRFDVEMSKGLVEDSVNYDEGSGDTSQLFFTRENNLMAEHPILKGRDATETVHSVMTFTGQSLSCSTDCVMLLRLGDSAMNRPADIVVDKSGGDTRVLITYGEASSAQGYAQAVAIEHGKGRVVILGEAAMLTAQLDGKTGKPFGMNVPGIDNKQFALNIMHWLSGIL